MWNLKNKINEQTKQKKDFDLMRPGGVVGCYTVLVFFSALIELIRDLVSHGYSQSVYL